MPRFLMPLCTATLFTLLAGCDSSDITTVKNATVPQDQTHTYDSALSGRASCASEEWRTFKDDSNRNAVEYRCVLKDAPELTAAMRVFQTKEINKEYQNYYQSLDQRAEEYRQAPAQQAALAAQAQAKLAAEEAQEAIENRRLAQQDPVAAMRRAAVRNETGSFASAKAMAERTQQNTNDASANLQQHLTSVQAEKERFQKSEQSALAAVEKTYGDVAKATEIFQWVVKGDEAYPGWAGVEVEKKDGSKFNITKNWALTMQDLRRSRGDDHVHYVLNIPGKVLPGLLETTAPAAKTTSNASSSKEACYDAKLKGFRSGMGDEAPISNDMMNEWRTECGMPSL